jgi:hypothetical protein
MKFSIGQRVRHSKKPEWGSGRVEKLAGDGKIQINFSHAGKKTLALEGVALEVIPETPGEDGLLKRRLNLEKIFRLCDVLHSEMSSNRSTTDDGGIALDIKKDLLKLGQLKPATRRDLLKWCHTGGSFVRGEPIAREICLEIYGSIPPRDS